MELTINIPESSAQDSLASVDGRIRLPVPSTPSVISVQHPLRSSLLPHPPHPPSLPHPPSVTHKSPRSKNNARFDLNLVSTNVQGLGDNQKMQALFKDLRSKKVDIAFVQESKLQRGKADFAKQQWRDTAIFGCGPSSARGVAILFVRLSVSPHPRSLQSPS